MTQLIVDKIQGVMMHSKPREISEYANLAAFPVVGRSGIIYIAQDVNKIYRYTDAGYIEMSGFPNDLAPTADKSWKLKVANITPPAIITVNYGWLYNFFAADCAQHIAAVGWHLPSEAEWNVLRFFLGDVDNSFTTTAAARLKEVGTAHWYSPNPTDNPDSRFNALPSGMRDNNGIFGWAKSAGFWWTATQTAQDPPQAFLKAMFSDAKELAGSNSFKTTGLSIRLLKDTTTLTDGQTGTYTGNDGTVYPTICIGTQEWMSVNLAETKYRDGVTISTVADQSIWLSMHTGVKCAYNNDEANVSETLSGAFSENNIASQDALEVEEGTNINVVLSNKKLTISAPLASYIKGPAVAVDSRICLFDAATGKLIKLSNVSIDANGTVTILGGTATILGKKAIIMPTGTVGIDSGLSIRELTGESIIQFGNNLSDYYTGAIDQAKSGSMIRLDTRDAAPVPGGHAYSAFQIQVRLAGAVYTAYKVPVQISGGAPEGALCISASGVVSVYYGLWTAGQITSTIVTGTAPLVIASQTKVNNLNVAMVDGKTPGAVCGLATLDVNSQLTASQTPYAENILSYGIAIDSTVSNPICARIGSAELHRSLPVQSKMKGCIIDSATGAVVYYLKATDWTKKENGAASSLDGTDGQVMVEVPSHWRKFLQTGTIQTVRISEVELPGFTYVPKFYIGAYEAALQRSVSKLCSIKNVGTDFRGGNNNAAYDAATNTFLGRPATVISRTDFRTYARNRGASNEWNQLTYEAYKSVFYLYLVEYANLNSQSAYNAAKDANGYAQGGLGNGVTDLVGGEWGAFNGYYPFIPCGYSDSLGNFTGEVTYNALDFGGAGVTRTTKVPRYRGIENIFGHIWKWVDGINVETQSAADGGLTKLWMSKNPADFTDASYLNYTYIGNLGRVYDYVKTMLLGEVMPELQGSGAGSSTYYCDYSYLGNIPGSGTDLRGVFFGASAHYRAAAGLAISITDVSPANSDTSVGARLCFLGE